jgi:hypothetical protein
VGRSLAAGHRPSEAAPFIPRVNKDVKTRGNSCGTRNLRPSVQGGHTFPHSPTVAGTSTIVKSQPVAVLMPICTTLGRITATYCGSYFGSQVTKKKRIFIKHLVSLCYKACRTWFTRPTAKTRCPHVLYISPRERHARATNFALWAVHGSE